MSKFLEKTLVQKLEVILKKEFGTDLTFREFSAGYGIADLVLAPNFSFSDNQVKRMPIKNFRTLQVLFSFKNNDSYSLSSLEKDLPFIEKKELKTQINFLIKNGYLKKNGNNTYKKLELSNCVNRIPKIIAIEAKLRDHKSGLIQAKRYQYFADESYLAILKSAEKNINFDEFNKHNIGLILFDSQNETIEIRHPNKNNKTYEKKFGLFAKEMMFNQSRNLSF